MAADVHEDRGSKRAERPRRKNGEATREALIEGAVRLFSEGGAAAVTLSAAARIAGITRRAAYHHFENKGELLATMEQWMEQKLIRVTEGSEEYGDPFWLLAGLAAENEQVIRSHVFDAMVQGAGDNAVIRSVIRQFENFEEKGMLKEGTDKDMAAIVAISSWFGAILAVSLGETPDDKHALAQRFGKTLHRSLFDGIFESEKDPYYSPDYLRAVMARVLSSSDDTPQA